jgi:HEPN domain-containing protein
MMVESRKRAVAKLAGFPAPGSEPIKGWEDFLREGKQFLATANKAYSRGKAAFTAPILYNLVAMAIEKLIMALLMKNGKLPLNHTMHDLVGAIDEFLPGELAGLGEELKRLDGFQEICDMESCSISPPTMAQISGMLTLALEVQSRVINSVGYR